MVQKIINNDLSAAYASKLALVDFNATWCGPCQMLHPVLEEMSEELAGKVDIYSVDVDQNGRLAEEFSIMNIPAVAVLKDGVKVDMTVGFLPKTEMMKVVEKHL